MRRFVALLGLALGVSMLVAACGDSEEITFTPTPTGTPTPAATQTPGPKPTASPTATPSLTSTPTPFATPTSTPGDLGPAPTALEFVPSWLETAWQVGRAPVEVNAALQAAGWQHSTDDLGSSDLNGDGQEEWLLTIFVDESGQGTVFGPPGNFWIVGEGGQLYSTFGDSSEVGLWTAPVVILLGDLTGDNLPEVIIETSSCGAHTCHNLYQAVSAHHGTIGNIVVGPDDGGALMAFPTAEFYDSTDDGLSDLVLTGGIVASIGAGIQQARSEVWAWDGTAITLADTLWAPSPWRFHVLYDANRAFDRPDYENAHGLYLRVINDGTLQDISEFPASGDTRDSARQFAAFRLVLLGLLADDQDAAAIWRDWLSLHYSDSPIHQAATALMMEWISGTGNLGDACGVATSLLLAAENPTGPLAYLGYANPELTAEDVCPIQA